MSMPCNQSLGVPQHQIKINALNIHKEILLISNEHGLSSGIVLKPLVFFVCEMDAGKDVHYADNFLFKFGLNKPPVGILNCKAGSKRLGCKILLHFNKTVFP